MKHETKYAQNLRQFPWHARNHVFKCTVVDQIADMCNDTRYAMLCAQLPLHIKAFINFIEETCHCRSYKIHRRLTEIVRYNSVYLIVFTVFITLQLLTQWDRSWNIIIMLLDMNGIFRCSYALSYF